MIELYVCICICEGEGDGEGDGYRFAIPFANGKRMALPY